MNFTNTTFRPRGASLLRAALAQPTEPLNQAALALQLGVTQQAVSVWVRGRSRPSRDSILELERLFKIPVRAWFEADTARTTPALKEVA